MVKMAVVPIVQRSVQGPKSHTIYNFNPWSIVEDIDVDEMKQKMMKQGCDCNSTSKETRLFATEEEILTKSVVPAWAGQYGSPI